ncbi:MAG TPA: lipopolysaccharide heptosyltransferase I [Dissulfurispiraceae bacterium]|nr:lipopolysaccharide heptosyltransferase I [Dissulfurispiraceae bacterium]
MRVKKININNIPRKIMVVKPSSLGDVVHSLPFLSALHECFPFAKIDWVIARGIEGMLEGNPLINKLWIIDKDKWKNVGRIPGTISELGRLARAVKAEKYDIVIDLQGLMRSGLITKATCAPVRIGFAEAREGSVLCYTHRVEGGRELHAVDRYLKVVSALGYDESNIRFPLPLVRESEKIAELKSKIGDYAVIVAGARWNTKKWPAENFAQVAASLDMASVVVGSESDRGIAMAIEKQSDNKAISMAGETDMSDLMWLIRGAKLMISNDSGPMHIAAAGGIPVVAIFGPTNPGRTGPYGPNNMVLKTNAECAPCYKRSCKDNRCMRDITPDRVLEAVRAIVARKP